MVINIVLMSCIRFYGHKHSFNVMYPVGMCLSLMYVVFVILFWNYIPSHGFDLGLGFRVSAGFSADTRADLAIIIRLLESFVVEN